MNRQQYFIAIFLCVSLMNIACKKEWCSKKCPEKEPLQLSWKIGCVENRNTKEKYLTISVNTEHYAIEQVQFKSNWDFYVDETLLPVELNENDFRWERGKRELEGILRQEKLARLLSTHELVHRRTTLVGRVKLNGEWQDFAKVTLP